MVSWMDWGCGEATSIGGAESVIVNASTVWTRSVSVLASVIWTEFVIVLASTVAAFW